MRTVFTHGVVALLVAGAASATTAYVLTRADTAKVVQRDIASLVREVRDLRKRAERVTGNPSADAVLDSPPPRSGPLTKQEFRQDFAELRREVVDLALALNHLKANPGDGPVEHQVTRDITDSPVGFEIAVEQPVSNRFVTIRNIGDDVVSNPRLSVNGKKQWFTIADIIDGVIDEGMSDRERALAVWAFLRDNRYHSRPAHNDIEMHDPVRYLNVYGYGYCDDSATAFQTLAEEAGVKARVWALEGHVVPEAFFEDGWHMLDPDGEVYYLEDDGQTIASVETLQQRPDLLRRYPSPQYADRPDMMVDVYTTADDNYVNEWYRKKSETLHKMDFSLRPGESIYRSWDNWGLYFADRFLKEPERYGNGRFLYRPILREGLYQKGNQVEGLALKAGPKPALAPDSSNGVWIIPVQSPYPLLSGRTRMVGAIGADGSVTLEFSKDGDRWQAMAHIDREGPVKIDASTRPYLRNGHGRPMYAYRLRVTLRGSARIEHVEVESDFQHAPHALPELEIGLNQIGYRDDSEHRMVQVEFGYDDHPSERASR